MDIGESEFFFGHFTAVGPENHPIADQSNRQGALMGELIARDAKKGVFNFYELRGDRGKNRWLYRGDSLDIFADIQLLHRQQDPQHPVFGSRLRCSGCHMEGGPIMKEFSPPHNDWWRETRKLPHLYLVLIQRREEAKQSEISKNPRGQILEPGFRAIFPEVSVSAVPG